jgi:YD repeat-containing protein
MSRVITIAALLALGALNICAQRPAHAQTNTTNVYDANGRLTGTVRHNGNSATFTDDRGRITGRATTDSNGTTHTYDANGRASGTITNSTRGSKR